MNYKFIGIILFIIGIILLAFGINAINTTTESTVETVTGKYTSGTMGYLISGIVLLCLGGFIIFRKPKK